jgi:hypothetical protein
MKDTVGIFHCFQQGIQTVVLIGNDGIHLRRRTIAVAARWTGEDDENRHNFSFTDCLIDRLSRTMADHWTNFTLDERRLPTDVRERFIVQCDDGVKQFLRIALQQKMSTMSRDRRNRLERSCRWHRDRTCRACEELSTDELDRHRPAMVERHCWLCELTRQLDEREERNLSS